MPEVVRKAAQRKGGRIKVKKGIGALSPERRKEITSMGGIAKRDRSKMNTSKSKEDTSDSGPLVERILGTLDED